MGIVTRAVDDHESGRLLAHRIRDRARIIGRNAMKSVNPYLNFAGNTEEAFRFYQTVFGGELQIVRFRDFGGNAMGVPEEDLDKIAHVALPLVGANMLMGTDTLKSFGQTLTAGNNFSITLEAENADEAEKLFHALSAGGTVKMPLSKTEWAEKYGMCTDKFAVGWMVNYTGDAQFPAG
jgi:PhnB protein